jgi:predicted enzyme related to lactoylglutathione lyase
MGNPFVHVELNTGDVARARQFYQGLFDWKLTDMAMANGHTYTMVEVGNAAGGVGGGMQQTPGVGAPSAWLSYVAVTDLDATVARARSLGAQIIEPRIDVPGMGAIGIFADPTGAVLGLWQPAQMQPAQQRKASPKRPAAKAKKPAARKPAAKKPAAKPKKRPRR